MKINNSDDLKDYIIELMKDKNISKQHDFIYDNELIDLSEIGFEMMGVVDEYFDWLEYDTLYMITPTRKSTREAGYVNVKRKIFYYYRPSGKDVIYYVVKSEVSGKWLNSVYVGIPREWVRAYAKLDVLKGGRSLMNWDKGPWGDVK